MTSIVMLVVFYYACMVAAAVMRKGIAYGLTFATGIGLLATAFWLSTPAQWYAVGSVTVWIGIAMGAVVLIGGAVEETRS